MTVVTAEPATSLDIAMSPDTAEALALVGNLHAELQRRRPRVHRFGEYFRGKHPLAYASDAWSAHHRERYKDFSDNWCGVVAASPAERITVNGFRLDDEDADSAASAAVEKTLARDWRLNDMEAQASQGFLQSIIAERSYVLVWGSADDEPVVTWERPDEVITLADPAQPRKYLAALKVWEDGDDELATLYTADWVWKWERRRVMMLSKESTTDAGLYVPVQIIAQGWRPRQDQGDDTWPLRNPLGEVPVTEIPNRPLLGHGPLSDIDGASHMQDAINLLWAYLFAAADHASLPARVVMGQEPPSLPILDEAGRKIGVKPVDMADLAKSRLLWLNGENTTISQWDPAKLDVFTAVVNVAVRHLAAQTRTPVHYIVGELTNVNGETLLAGESGLVKKVEEFCLFASPAVRRINGQMVAVRGNVAAARACRAGTVLWANAETRTTAQLSDAALKDRQIGLPLEWIAEHRLGLTQPEVRRLMQMVADEQNDPGFAKPLSGALTGGGTADQQDAAGTT